jgi:ABC-type antimicrobial peptide transport system permease subunit
VGVVEDALYEGPRQGIRRQAFFPFDQMNQPVGVAFYLRTSVSTGGIIPAIRRKVLELDATIPVYEIKTLDEQLDETLGTERLSAILSIAFGVLATLLAAVGLYGVMTLTVARRTREIGLRIALGARRGDLVWMVMRDAVVLLGVGLGLGIPSALLLSRYLSSQLFGVAAADVRTVSAAAVSLGLVAVVAAFVPAHRATTIDPMRALRHE